MKNPKTRPIAVLISDIHYNINTLALADAAMRMAVEKANDLNVPLIVAGDLHDTKANMRAECVNAMIETFELCRLKAMILVGNHDRINEKSSLHSLNFLKEHVNFVVEKPSKFDIELDDGTFVLGYLIPYYHDVKELRSYLKTLPIGSRIIMHQGLQGSDSGEYIQDKSALTYDDVKDFRVISGHYHRRQDIKTGRPQAGAVGLFSYIGNPYTLGFGEAEHPEKGFQVLMDDGTLEFVPTKLRRHVIYNWGWDARHEIFFGSPFLAPETDARWVKIRGTKQQLFQITKSWIKDQTGLTGEFRLDLISTDEEVKVSEKQKSLSQPELLDSLIEGASSSPEEVKALWRVLCE